MPKFNLNISGGGYGDVDESAHIQLNERLFNGVLNEIGLPYKRPGLKLYSTLPGAFTGVDALIPYIDDVVAVSGGSLYRVKETGEATLISGQKVNGNLRTTHAITTSNLALAKGEKIVLLDSSYSSATTVSDTDAPTLVSQLLFKDSRLIANSLGTHIFYWSDVDEDGEWDGLSFAQAASNPDPITVIKRIQDDYFFGGSDSIEAWQTTADATATFVRQIGYGIIESGIIAPGTCVELDGNLFFLDNERIFQRLEGRTTVALGCPFEREIANYKTVEDAFSFQIVMGDLRLYVTIFPSEGVTICFDYSRSAGMVPWFRWTTGSKDDPWPGNSHCFAWNKTHLVGDRFTGRIYELDRQTYFDHPNKHIRFERRTGSDDHGFSEEKECKSLRIRMKRGLGSEAGSEPKLMVRWRDGGNKIWSNEVWMSLGKIGEDEYLGELRKLGKYFSREWSFLHADGTPLVITWAQVECEISSR